MPLEIIVTTSDSNAETLVLPSGSEISEDLGDHFAQLKDTTVRISDLLGRLFEHVQETIDFDCDIELTLKGGLSLVGKGDVKYVFFNVGGAIERETTMEVKLKTHLSPFVPPP